MGVKVTLPGPCKLESSKMRLIQQALRSSCELLRLGRLDKLYRTAICNMLSKAVISTACQL